jgi:hypothetical protein
LLGVRGTRTTATSRKTDAVDIRTNGIDTGKNTAHLSGLDDQGAIVLQEKVSRSRIAARLVNMPPCLIGIEAGMAIHYVARDLLALGHAVRQVPPAYAKPFRQGHKNDFREAHAIAEDVQRPFNPLARVPLPHSDDYRSRQQGIGKPTNGGLASAVVDSRRRRARSENITAADIAKMVANR